MILIPNKSYRIYGLLPSLQLLITNMLTGHYSERTKKLLQYQLSEAVVVDECAVVTLDLHLANMFLIISLYITLNKHII